MNYAKRNFNISAFVVFLLSGCDRTPIGSASACLPPGHERVSVPVDIPAGLGIKRVKLKHDRDENSMFDVIAIARTKPAGGKIASIEERHFGPILENRDLLVFDTKNNTIRSGSPQVSVMYRVIGWYYWGKNSPPWKYNFAKIETEKHNSYHEIRFWTGCNDAYSNTTITIQFSNHPN